MVQKVNAGEVGLLIATRNKVRRDENTTSDNRQGSEDVSTHAGKAQEDRGIQTYRVHQHLLFCMYDRSKP